MLRRAPFDQLLEAFSSPDPTPGGGSAAALAGAVGASLLAMVAGLAKTRHGTGDDRRTLDAARTILLAERDRLSELVDLDTAAYDRVVEAFRLPRATEEEKAARSAAVQAALRGATETPLSVMRACEAVIRAGDAVAASGNPSASSDVLVGFELALAGLRAARLNVDINLGSVKDAAFVEVVRKEVAQLERDAETGATRARSHAG